MSLFQKMEVNDLIQKNIVCQNAIISVAVRLGWSEKLYNDIAELGNAETSLRNLLTQ